LQLSFSIPTNNGKGLTVTVIINSFLFITILESLFLQEHGPEFRGSECSNGRHAIAWWFTQFAKSRKIAGWSPDEVIEFFSIYLILPHLALECT
jgi:hypothetical protein